MERSEVHIIKLYLLITYAISSSLVGFASPLDETSLTLDSIKTALHRLEEDIERGAAEENSLLSEIDFRKQEISLRNERIRDIRSTEQELLASARQMEDSLSIYNADLSKLEPRRVELNSRRSEIEKSLAQALVARRRMTSWTILSLLLGSESWGDLLRRRFVVQRMESALSNRLSATVSEFRSIDDTENRIADIEFRLQEIQSDLSQSRESARIVENQIGTEIRDLERSRANLQRRLRDINKSQNFLELQRQETEQAQTALAEMVTRLERGETETGLPLNLLKGKLPWPAAGKVVREFGVVRNREWNTLTDNPGIDITVSENESVRVIADGKINSVSWLRGFGNVCIVEHAGSFYTVYAQLENVTVESGQQIHQGDVLGKPGWNPDGEDYRIHFELWSGKEKKNPREWLSKLPASSNG